MDPRPSVKMNKTKAKTRSKKTVNGKAKDGNKNIINHKCESNGIMNNDNSNLNNHLITDYFPTLSRRRINSKTLALQHEGRIRHHIANDVDPIDLFIVRDFKDKGKGVIAAKTITKGSFVCEYSGDLINTKEAKLKEVEYESSGAGCYMYYFNWSNTVWCIDATKPSDRIGRLINHSRKSPNCKTQLFIHNNKPHLIFIAMRDIDRDEELLYDYGERNKFAIESHPWLKTT